MSSLEQAIEEQFKLVVANTLGTQYHLDPRLKAYFDGFSETVRVDFNNIINFIRQKFPVNCTQQDIYNVLKEVLTKVVESINARYQQPTNTFGQSLFGQPQQQTLFGTAQPNVSFFGNNQTSSLFGSVQNPYQPQPNQNISNSWYGSGTHTDNQNNPVVQQQTIKKPEEIMPESFTVGDKSTLAVENHSYEIHDVESTFNGKKIQHKKVSLAAAMNNIEEVAGRVINFVKKESPFIIDVDYRTGVFVNIPSEIFTNLYNLYKSEDLFDQEPAPELSKRILNCFTDYINRINYGVGVTLTEFFLNQITPFIRSYIVSPNDLSSELVPKTIQDLYKLFEEDFNSDIVEQDFFESIRDIIIYTVMVDYIVPGNICDWANVNDHIDILNNYKNSICINNYSMLQEALMDTVDITEAKGKTKKAAKQKETDQFTVIKIPCSAVITNIYPNVFQYRFEQSQRFDPFIIDKNNNIIENVICPTTGKIEKRQLVIYPDKYTRYVCTVSIITNGEFRLASSIL